MKSYIALTVGTGMFLVGALPAQAQFGDLLKKAQSAIEEVVEEVVPIEESNSSTEEAAPSGENSVASEKTSASATEKAPQLAEVSTETSCTDFAYAYGWNSYEYEQCEVLRQQAFDDRKAKILAMDIDETTDCYGSPFTEMGVYAAQDCQYAQAQYHQAEQERKRVEQERQAEEKRLARIAEAEERREQDRLAAEERERQAEALRLARIEQQQIAEAEQERKRKEEEARVASLPLLTADRLEEFLETPQVVKVQQEDISFDAQLVRLLVNDFRLEGGYIFKGDMSCYDSFDDRIARGEVTGYVEVDRTGQMNWMFGNGEFIAAPVLMAEFSVLETGLGNKADQVRTCKWRNVKIKA